MPPRARRTSDACISTPRRVAAIPGQPARRSLAFFRQPDREAEIVPLDGADAHLLVRSGPHLMGAVRAAGT